MFSRWSLDRVKRAAAAGFALLALLVIVGVTLIGEGGGTPARADDDDFFNASPAPLASSHAALDNRDHCNDCHTGGRAISKDKCLACHDHADLKARIDAGEGFHASALVKGKACESCHLDHKGVDYDLMGWRSIAGGKDAFDHKLTGWPLQGKHVNLACDDCHKSKNQQGLRTYLGTDKLCGSCHKDDQPHGFERKDMMACERCHGESVWKPEKTTLEFDHNSRKDAEMPLDGSHADVSCGKCHPKTLFNLPKKDPDYCGNCHKSPHDGQLFGKTDCQTCHSPKYGALDKYRFDHDAKTKFDLGGHAKLTCYTCHTQKLGEKKPSRACAPCHADDNKHKDRFDAFGEPPKCESCHPSTSWKPSAFNHNKQTKFALTGKHADVACRACHRGKGPADYERFDPAKVGCMGCHKHKNVHDRQYTDQRCTECHQEAGEIKIKPTSVDEFHGPKSRYPLTDGHKGVLCEKCHKDDSYKGTATNCGTSGCHVDSLHKDELGKKCENCHKPGVWAATKFDHTKDTTWPLQGLHKTIPECKDCHPKRDYDGTPTTCGSAGCHGEDDAHQGKLGDACERCHKESGDNVFNHNEMSRFKLDGKHLVTRCADCHASVTFKPRPTDCFGCHPEPTIHEGQYGTGCETCHSTATFEDIKPLHDVGDFSLSGAHDNQPCARCHRDNRPLAGSGNLCLNCHRQDDVHSNSLSPRCGECHTQWSFAPAKFDHATVGCNLTGLHRVLPCYECHKTGNFGGLQPTCYGCHRDEAARKGGTHEGYTACTTCHNPNGWEAGSRTAGSGSGQESICR